MENNNWFCPRCSAELGEYNRYCEYCKYYDNIVVWNPERNLVLEIRERHIVEDASYIIKRSTEGD